MKEELARRGYWWPEGRRKKAPVLVLPEDDTFTLRALASVLHDIYVAAENIFELVARDLDEQLPPGPSWHQELPRQMTLAIPEGRPPVLRKETAAELDEHRAFRHVFRNVYGFNLDTWRLEQLLRKLPRAYGDLQTDVQDFLAALRASLPDHDQ
ncbi:MAG: hypothetical protein D9V47_04475 [Clostridia bacterium]|nr:MAG: hypothetical protein D9V47_04475 [Clostridia bacterium]